MKIASSIPKAVEIDVEPPFFRKQTRTTGAFVEYAALIDENTFIKVSCLRNEYLNVISQLTSDCKRDIIEAFSTWEHIDEQEFMDAYNTILEHLSLAPKLVYAADPNDLKDINI